MEPSVEELQKKVNELQEQLNEARSSSKRKIKVSHSADFWSYIRLNCTKSTVMAQIKSMINNKKMSVYDTNPTGRSLLCIAAVGGAYDLAKYLINHKLLLFASMNVEAGNEIQKIADNIHRQNGIMEVLSNELSEIGEQSKKIWEDTLMELMIRIISKRLSFSDKNLGYAWNMAMNQHENVLDSDLWKAIQTTCSQIVQNGTKRDWTWFKMCLLPSTIWFKDISKGKDKEPHFLYYEALKLVNIEAINQMSELEKDLGEMANEQDKEWNELIEWKADIKMEYDAARQDKVFNGVKCMYTRDGLSVGSDSTFNAPNFYDHNQYLSQLILLAQMVDDEFHTSVQRIYGIDGVTNEGKILSLDDKKSEVGIVEYMRGPVKLIERARAKAQNDYAKEPYPSSACVIDFNRCALIFDDISSLLRGLKLFVNKVQYYQSGNIIGIARVKNGFIEYVKEAQYADIKLNVVIKGKHNSIIGEVQFLLRAMKDYKDKAHNLYAIQRKEESIKTSISATLPILLNEEKKIMTIGCKGNVKQMCSLMIVQNQSIKDLMFVDKASGNTILHTICTFGHMKLLLYLEANMSKKEFIHHLFVSNKMDVKCIEYCASYTRSILVKHLFAMKEVQQRYENNKPLLFRLLFWLFVNNSDWSLTEYVLDCLKVTKEKVVQMLKFRCPTQPGYSFNSTGQSSMKFQNFLLLHQTAKMPLNQIKNLGSYIGEKALVENLFNLNGWNNDAMGVALYHKSFKVVEYLLSFEAVKARYMKDNAARKRLISSLKKCKDKNMKKIIVDRLELTKKEM